MTSIKMLKQNEDRNIERINERILVSWFLLSLIRIRRKSDRAKTSRDSIVGLNTASRHFFLVKWAAMSKD